MGLGAAGTISVGLLLYNIKSVVQDESAHNIDSAIQPFCLNIAGIVEIKRKIYFNSS
jgi:hypothetical protein